MKTFSDGVLLMKKSVSLEKEKLSLEENRFNTGRSSTRRVIEYQQDLLRTELIRVALLLDFRISISDLSKVLNITLKKYKEVL